MQMLQMMFVITFVIDLITSVVKFGFGILVQFATNNNNQFLKSESRSLRRHLNVWGYGVRSTSQSLINVQSRRLAPNPVWPVRSFCFISTLSTEVPSPSP